MNEYKLYWGDLHTHFEDLDAGDAILRDARENIDFCAVLCYPFIWRKKRGLQVESVRQRPEFLQWWEKLQKLARTHYHPGCFVTFLGYEWHGDRTRYGDHNVIYFDEDNPLDDAWTLEELYRNLQGRKAIAIPHHTGYCRGWRGKNWDVFNEMLTPVMEIFSGHGSSEGCNTPFPLEQNSDMGPRTTGGTFHDALARGYRIGVIGSNDGAGLPGRWGIGRAGVWARECTREAIWEALLARRTYATTGDRIELDFQIEGAPMGSVIQVDSPVDVDVTVVGSHAIDRVELLQNGYVVDTYCHSGRWEYQAQESGRFKVFIEAGWGPAADYGYRPRNWKWLCRLDVEKGHLVAVERCFSLLGQRVRSQDRNHCTWELVTAARTTANPFGMCQGLIFEIEGLPETRLRLQAEGVTFELSVEDLLGNSHLIPLIEESKHRIQETFGLGEEELGNCDPYYHNARKIKLHQAIPEKGYRVAHTFRNLKLTKGRNYFYVRVSQLNGQLAWSSPIWVDCKA